MNKIHDIVVRYMRDYAARDNGALHIRFSEMSDEALTRAMFLNYRGERGIRLTKVGLELMKRFFRSCEVALPEGETVMPKHLLYLESYATLPYYCSMDGYVFFDIGLGVKLKLADGRMDTLIEIQGAQ